MSVDGSLTPSRFDAHVDRHVRRGVEDRVIVTDSAAPIGHHACMRLPAVVALMGLSGCSFMAATTPRGSTHSCIPDRASNADGLHRGPLMDIVVVGAAAATDIALYIRR